MPRTKKCLMTECMHDGATYSWDGRHWTDADGVAPPLSIVHILNAKIEEELIASDSVVSDPTALAKLARSAMAAGQVTRALRLAERALDLRPQNDGYAATLVSLLRKAHRSDEAVPILKRFRNSKFTPLLVTGSAVLCDVERWEDALVVVRRALTIEKSGEAFAVLDRIKKQRPDLVPD